MNGGNSFIRVDRDLWQSDEWRNLSVNAQVALVDMWAQFNGRNNGQISYGLRDAMARLHCSKSTALRAFAELQNAHLNRSPTIPITFLQSIAPMTVKHRRA